MYVFVDSRLSVRVRDDFRTDRESISERTVFHTESGGAGRRRSYDHVYLFGWY